MELNSEDLFNMNKCDVRLLFKMQCFKCKRKGIFNYSAKKFISKKNSSFPFEDQGPVTERFLMGGGLVMDGVEQKRTCQ